MPRNVPNRAYRLGLGLFTGHADVTQKGIIQQRQFVALPPDGKGIQQHADKVIRRTRRAYQVSGEVHGGLFSVECVMEHSVHIIMLDVSAISVVILKTNDFERYHQQV
jgi:hypothetical protein